MRTLLTLLTTIFVLTACSDDDDTALPPYVNTLAEIATSAEGKAAFITPDGGEQYAISSDHSGLTHDSIYRVQVLALFNEDHTAYLQQIKSVLSPLPREVSEEKRKYHPVDVLALWSSKRYINMRLALHTATEPHAFAFVEEGTDILDDGTRRLRLHLYHDRGANPEYYTREVYISCPIYQYQDQLREGQDSIIFSITTYQAEQALHLLYGQ